MDASKSLSQRNEEGLWAAEGVFPLSRCDSTGGGGTLSLIFGMELGCFGHGFLWEGAALFQKFSKGFWKFPYLSVSDMYIQYTGPPPFFHGQCREGIINHWLQD